MTVREGLLPFKAVVEKSPSRVTAYAGLPLLVEALRTSTSKRWYRALRKALGYSDWKAVQRHVETLVLLVGAGGECLDDVRLLVGDPGLKLLLGYVPSSPTQLKDFLYRFHQDAKGTPWTAEEDARLSLKGTAVIREEGPGLRCLGELVDRVVERVHGHLQRTRATLDVDATIIEAHKKQALRCYEGTVGYQPQMAWWAEAGVFVRDQFRDGHVPAQSGILDFVEKVLAALPASVTSRRLRGDSALYDESLLTWLDEHGVEFAVSADMSEALARHSRALPESAWKPYQTLREHERPRDQEEQREWAEVPDFVPDWKRNRSKNHKRPFRYIAIRVRSRQRELWENGGAGWRYFAIVTNLFDWDGARLLRWQREKQGTIEHAHGVLKNDLAAGTLPCGRFGANAAFVRLNVLTHNLLALLKTVALPAKMATLRPKALRFQLLCLAARLVRHGRRLVLQLSESQPASAFYAAARLALLRLVEPASAGAAPCEPQAAPAAT